VEDEYGVEELPCDAIDPTLRTCKMAGITIKDGTAPVF
jgi:hypothetical protein